MYVEVDSEGMKFVGNIPVAENLSVKFHMYFDQEGLIVNNFKQDVLKFNRQGSIVPLIPIWENWCKLREVKYETEPVGKWYNYKYWLLKLGINTLRKDFREMSFDEYKETYRIGVVDED